MIWVGGWSVEEGSSSVMGLMCTPSSAEQVLNAKSAPASESSEVGEEIRTQTKYFLILSKY